MKVQYKDSQPNGACRFLLKDVTRAELVAAIQLAARGECEGDPVGSGERHPDKASLV